MKKYESIPEPIKKSLRLSRREGMPAAAMQGIIDYYLTPFALSLGATAQQVGFLVSIPNLIASISQLYAVKVVDWAGSRLRFLVGGTLVQSMTLVPLAALAVGFCSGSVPALIAFAVIFRVLASFIGTAWGSLVSDYLPPQKGEIILEAEISL